MSNDQISGASGSRRDLARTHERNRRVWRRSQSKRPIDLVLMLLKNVQQSGDQWSARCPAHHDSRNSLSVGEGSDGQVLVYCHAGCSFDDILDKLDLHPSLLYPRRRRVRRVRRRQRREGENCND